MNSDSTDNTPQQTSQIINLTNTTDEQKQKSQNILVHSRYFTCSIIEFAELIKLKSYNMCANVKDIKDSKTNEMNEMSEKLIKSHEKLRNVCDQLIHGLTNVKNYDIGSIAKKVYKTISSNLEKIHPELSLKLFNMRTSHGKRMTIIPGLDIGLVCSSFDEKELELFWAYFLLIYISSVGMITEINSHRKEGKVWKIIPHLRQIVNKSGILTKGLLFNPYITYNVETQDYSIETLKDSFDKKLPTEENNEPGLLSGLINNPEITTLFNDLRNLNESNIAEINNSLVSMLGIEDNSDVRDVCETMVTEIVNGFKNNADGSLIDILQNCSGIVENMTNKIGSKVDKNKMSKTMSVVTNFINNTKVSTDENNIAHELLEKLKSPLEMIESMKNGDTVDMNKMNSYTEQLKKELTNLKK